MGNYHEWGDEDFDWKSLYDAERMLIKILKIFNIGVHSKEKYGVLRTSVYLFDGSLHHFMYPGYFYSQFPNWLWVFDINYIQPAMTSFPLKYITKAIALFQVHVGYRLAYYLVMRKYPHIQEEICVDAQFPEAIIGGLAIHNKYWSST